MDNLEQLICQSITLDEYYGKCVSCSCCEELICFISDKNFTCVYGHSNTNKFIQKKIEGKELKHIEYLASHNLIFLATDYELILSDRGVLEYNVCYISERRIVKIAWNPAQTAFIIIDEDNTIVLFNLSIPQFEVSCSNDLNAAVPSSIYVGWGSENTQFQGPKSRLQKNKEKVSVPLHEFEYSPPNISWRGNGQLIAINFFKNGRRFVKVFNNELQPLYESSEYPNLAEPVAFMAAGQCIACAAVGETNSVVIFEKNCKVKSVFQVPENKGTIIKLQFHPQMNMLAVYSVDAVKYGYLNIYLLANGIWLLKNQLYFNPKRVVQDFQWINLHEPLNTICRLVVFTAQSIEYYTFRFVINRCPSSSIVAVVDGRNVAWYNFSERIIPPPMSDCLIIHSRSINRILFHPQKSLYVVLDSNMQATVVDFENNNILLTSEDLNLENASSFHSIIWNENKIQINIESCGEETLQVQEANNLTLEVKTIKKVESKFVLPYNDSDCLASHLSLDLESTMIYLTKKVLASDAHIELDFSLSRNQELYLNDNIVHKGVTSFIIYRDYLILTTAACKMYCLRLLQDYEALLLNKLDWEKKYSREIEQGARIVTLSNSCPPQIILVLPRGNLETIRCRLLTIDIIEKLLRENDWKTAIDLTRTERINWNILIDLNPKRFSDHIKDFVKAAEFCTNLSLIVNDFSEKNSFYENCLLNFPRDEYDKIEIIKDIVTYLTTTDLIGNLSSIVSIQYKHFSLKSALNYIKIVYQMDPVLNQQICKKALQLLSNKGYFKDILEATYGLFNLDFLTFVYHNSTEDPRIYEPEIAEFRKLKPIELRFKMSLKGNDPKEAIKYLLRCDNYDTVFVESFILKHKLEEVAYKCLPSFYKHFETVSLLYAKCLSLKQKHSEAALILKRANLVSQALEEYKKALDWREVLSIMITLKCKEEQKREVLYDLSNKLSRVYRIEEAVILLDKYNNDHIKAIQLLVEHKAFRKAICLTKEHNAIGILDELVIPSLKSYIIVLKDRIAEFEMTFKKYFNRLQQLREEKKRKLDNSALGIFEGGDDLYFDSASTISSYVSSRGTSGSRSSQFSSKSRRKEARKKIDLREGGYYEDIALIRALHILYSDVFSLGKDVKEVCLISDHGDLESAKSLHGNLSCLQDLMKKHVPLIWCDVFINTPTVLNNEIIAITENKTDLDPEYCVPPGGNVLSDEWKLEIFL